MGIVWVALVLGCGEPEPDTDDPPVLPVYPDPVVTILSPVDGATAPLGDVEVTVEVSEFDLTGRTPETGLGGLWFHLLVPEAWAHRSGEKPNGFLALRIDGVTVLESTETTNTLSFAGLAEGEHRIAAELMWYDGDRFYPPTTKEIVVHVTP